MKTNITLAFLLSLASAAPLCAMGNNNNPNNLGKSTESTLNTLNAMLSESGPETPVAQTNTQTHTQTNTQITHAQIIAQSDNHPSVDEVYSRFLAATEISLADPTLRRYNPYMPYAVHNRFNRQNPIRPMSVTSRALLQDGNLPASNNNNNAHNTVTPASLSNESQNNTSLIKKRDNTRLSCALQINLDKKDDNNDDDDNDNNHNVSNKHVCFDTSFDTKNDAQ